MECISISISLGMAKRGVGLEKQAGARIEKWAVDFILNALQSHWLDII